MKHMRTLSLLLILNTLYFSLLYAPCNQGTLTQVSGSPFATGSTPDFVAYSPLVPGSSSNNLFAAVANFGGNVSVYSVNTSTGVFTAVSGSPFSAGNGAQGCAFSPFVYENLFAAVANETDGTVSVYSVNLSTGAFTAVSGSPFATGTSPVVVAFSPLIKGNLFAAVANSGSTSVSVYTVNTLTGAFTAVAGSPFATGTVPEGVAFSPLVNGNLFAAVSNVTGNSVSVYSVNTSTGVFTAVAGSPFATTGTHPIVVAFSPFINGNLFAATSNNTTNNVSVFSVNTSTGVFTAVAGSPFAAGTGTITVAFSPLVNGNLFAAVDNTTSVSVYQVNTSTGVFTQVSGSPFTFGTSLSSIAFSPIVTGGLFAATSNQGGANNVLVFQVNVLIPAITTLSQYILSGASVTLNGTITGGTQPYAITWQDSTVQSGIAVNTFSRTVSPTRTTIYDVATISDTNACTAGPSNTVTIGVRTCP